MNRTARITRALGALFLLGALVVGIPWALAHYIGSPLPHDIPELAADPRHARSARHPRRRAPQGARDRRVDHVGVARRITHRRGSRRAPRQVRDETFRSPARSNRSLDGSSPRSPSGSSPPRPAQRNTATLRSPRASPHCGTTTPTARARGRPDRSTATRYPRSQRATAQPNRQSRPNPRSMSSSQATPSGTSRSSTSATRTAGPRSTTSTKVGPSPTARA